MSAIRRQGVTAEHGSLEAYRAYARQNRANCLAEIEDPSTDPKERLQLRQDLANWDVDLAWVLAELASDAVAA